MENKRTLGILGAVIGVVILLGLCTCCVGVAALTIFSNTNPATPNPVLPTLPPISPKENIPVESTPVPPTIAPPPDEAQETFDAVKSADIPNADLHELGIRFLGVDPNTSRLSSTENPDYPIGTKRRFNVSDVDTDRQFEIDATLVYKTAHVYMWVEEGVRVNERRLKEAADLFEAHTYPTNREFFGSEWAPGVDGDPHLSILHARGLGRTVAGYFSSPDSYVKIVRDDSNEMEMFYINIDNIVIGDDFYNGVLAHEFQHMIHWNNDRNEETWLNEGCSELAMALNDRALPGGNYDVGSSDYAYMRTPDTQLTSWPEGTAGDASANYGGAYLFMEYFLDRFGEQATQSLVSHDENGMDSVDAVLREAIGADFSHKELFADWLIANLLDAPELGNGRYGYRLIDPSNPRIDQSYNIDLTTEENRSTVHQYGVDYIEVNSDVPVQFNFQGSTQTRLINTEAYSGQYLWWSNRADESDTRLTRVIDLTDAVEAELRFQSWYHIEEDWDYAYVVVGTTSDGVLPSDLQSANINWQILDDKSLGCTTSNPNGNNFGCGLTGKTNGWELLRADLTPYIGQEIALRFEYITDAAVNQPGFAVDDIQILIDGESALDDNAEDGKGNWIDEGFVRHANVLPQEWIVQVVTFADEPQVESLLIVENTEGEWRIPLGNGAERAVIAVSALSPLTTEIATYQYTISPVE